MQDTDRVGQVLITGTSGFIGSHIARMFLTEGIHVIGIDRNAPPEHIRTLPGGKFIITDISRKRGIAEILATYKPACIIHHASNLVDVELSVAHPEKAIKDLSMTVQLLETARKFGLRHVIYASSANVYGCGQTTPINESAPVAPSSPYGLTKLAVEQYLSYLYDAYGIPCTVLRYFNVYGPGQSVRNEPVIPTFINGLMKHDQVILYGGSQIRDFVFVTDVARANYLAHGSPVHGIFNIGSGKPVSIKLLLSRIAEIVGTKPNVIVMPPHPATCMYSRAVIRKARKYLSWTPETSLVEGLMQTVKYFS